METSRSTRRNFTALGLTTALASTLGLTGMTGSALAQEPNWPRKSVRWIVPFPAGGSADVLARTVAQKLSVKWGQQVMVDNRPGGFTTIGASEAIRAAPDGYTLFQPIDSTMTMNPFMFSKLGYQPMRDFTHISQLAGLSLALLATNKLRAQTVPELIAMAKAQPDSISYGEGTTSAQLAGEMLKREAGVRIMHVPYKGSSDVLRGLLSGDIDFAVDGIAPYIGLIKEGKVRALATTGAERAAAVPDVLTLGELGYKGVVIRVWHGLSAPAGLPVELGAKIQADVRAVLAMDDVKARLSGIGLEAIGSDADQYLKVINAEAAKLGPLIKEFGLKLD